MRCGDASSIFFSVFNGVRQGSVLSSVLFMIYMDEPLLMLYVTLMILFPPLLPCGLCYILANPFLIVTVSNLMPQISADQIW